MALDQVEITKLIGEMEELERSIRSTKRSIGTALDSLERNLARKEMGEPYEPVTAIERKIEHLELKLGKLERSMGRLRERAKASWR